ncbi:hypothetical protein ACFFU9_10825 [Mariniflexile ostreae]|uniref:Uncharacterized protein n=1 Tax=Mariniflexile ostreae TaxID=1520892 RepID=A0ABV5FCQ8_9FLAO
MQHINKAYHFQFNTKITEASHVRKIKTIHFFRDVSITLFANDELFLRYQLFTSKITINSNYALPNCYLIRQMGYVFDEIEIGVNRQSGLIKKVYNLKKIQERWAIIKAKLEIDNIGAIVEAMFLTITNVLHNEKELIAFLSDYKMFGLYFSSITDDRSLLEKPINQPKILSDFDNHTITELFLPKKDKPNAFGISEKIIEDNKVFFFDRYSGELEYENNQVYQAYLEVKKEKTHILYCVNRIEK